MSMWPQATRLCAMWARHAISSPPVGARGWASIATPTPPPAPPRFCVVGSGPAGFYTADKLLKLADSSATVDIVDRLPTPFGLVRSGVAPDHPDTKAVVNRFTQILHHPRCEFLGNVTLGRDVSAAELRDRYDGVVLAYGAEDDRHLGVPGEDGAGVFSTRELVWWYNGHPEYRALPVDLANAESVVVFGLGNVAVDCARILLKDPAGPLKHTDITQHALDALAISGVKRVYMVGRRGPVQGAFTPKELREMLSLPNVKVVIRPEDLQLTTEEQAALQAGDRKSRRVYEVLSKAAAAAAEAQESPLESTHRELHLSFFRSPAEVLRRDDDGGAVRAVRLEKTRVVDGRAVGTGETEEVAAEVVLRSIGYKGLPVDGVPFDSRAGVVPNKLGRVLQGAGDAAAMPMPGLYVCGWLKRGPSGIIGSNLVCAQETVQCVQADLAAGVLPRPTRHTAGLRALLQERGVKVVDRHGWARIDAREVADGAAKDKPREKLTCSEQLLSVGGQREAS